MKEIIQSIDRKEWFFLIFISIFLVFLTISPFIFAWLVRPEGSQVTGINFLTPGDTPFYYSYIEQAKSGQLLFKNLYTPEQQTNYLFNPLWLFGGLLASLFSWSSAFAYWFLKILLIPVSVWVIYLLVSYLIKKKIIRKLTFLVIIFSTGMSGYFSTWFLQNFYQNNQYISLPMDLWVPESNTFLTLIHGSLTNLAQIFLFLTFLFFLLSIHNKRIKYLIYAGLTNLILVLLHPFMLAVVILVMVVYWQIQVIIKGNLQSGKLKRLLVILTFSLPAVFYYVFLYFNNEVFRLQNQQNINLTPDWWMIFFSYGFLLPLFCLGVCAKKNKFDHKQQFILVWFLGQFCLLWSPLFFQRRLAEGMHLPLAYFAGIGAWFFYQKFSQPIKKLFNPKAACIFAFVVLLLFTNFLVWLENFKKYKINQDAYLYQDRAEQDLYSWLKCQDKVGVILAPYPYNNLIPGFAGRQVYYGHHVGTVNYPVKAEQANWFYQTELTAEKQQWLKQENINVIVLPKPEFSGLVTIDGYKLAFTNSKFLVFQSRD